MAVHSAARQGQRATQAVRAASNGDALISPSITLRPGPGKAAWWTAP
ncbi:MAG TPA: hypothetical protein VGG16_25150 [Streptosporangiaceae bacterium]